MTRILIIEDEPIIASDLEMILSKVGYEVLGIFDYAEEAMPYILKEQPDLLLLDIELAGEMSGVELAEIVKLKTEIPFLFITSFFDKATIDKVERTNPAAYIVKPFQEKNLLVNIELALHKTQQRLAGKKTVDTIEKVFVKHKHELIALQTDDITFLEAYDNYTHVFTDKDKYLLSHTLKSIEEKLHQSGFIRVHKSYLLNIAKISSIQEGYVFIQDQKIPLGKAYKQNLMNAITVL